jgi:hypothetical protein
MASPYFDKIKSAGTVYLSDENGDGQLADVRLAVARLGEDMSKVVAQFWEEHPNVGFAIAPIVPHGLLPLCSMASLTAALAVTSFETGSTTEKKWREACEYYGVKWPSKRAVAHDGKSRDPAHPVTGVKG